MLRTVCLLFVLCLSGVVNASHTFSCKISDISTSQSYPNYVVVHMSCDMATPITSGTNGCTSSTISTNSFTFDATSNVGKMRLSMLMMAMTAKKTVTASTYGTCPSQVSSVPLLYSFKVYGE